MASVEYLNVGKSNLEDDDVNQLCSALQSNTTLHTLILHGNKIGTQEVRIFFVVMLYFHMYYFKEYFFLMNCSKISVSSYLTARPVLPH